MKISKPIRIAVYCAGSLPIWHRRLCGVCQPDGRALPCDRLAPRASQRSGLLPTDAAFHVPDHYLEPSRGRPRLGRVNDGDGWTAADPSWASQIPVKRLYFGRTDGTHLAYGEAGYHDHMIDQLIT